MGAGKGYKGASEYSKQKAGDYVVQIEDVNFSTFVSEKTDYTYEKWTFTFNKPESGTLKVEFVYVDADSVPEVARQQSENEETVKKEITKARDWEERSLGQIKRFERGIFGRPMEPAEIDKFIDEREHPMLKDKKGQWFELNLKYDPSGNFANWVVVKKMTEEEVTKQVGTTDTVEDDEIPF